MLTYKKNDAFALMAISILLNYAHNKRLGSKGLTILFVGYDESYSVYQHSLRLFFKEMNKGKFNLISFVQL